MHVPQRLSFIMRKPGVFLHIHSTKFQKNDDQWMRSLVENAPVFKYHRNEHKWFNSTSAKIYSNHKNMISASKG